MAYGFSALLANEFHNTNIDCTYPNLIPFGPEYTDSTYQSCAGVGGAVQGATSLTGDDYLASLSYSHENVWRNFGINWAFWVLFASVTIICTSRWKSAASAGSSLLIPRENAKYTKKLVADEESQSSLKGSGEGISSQAPTVSGDATDSQLVRNTSVFTWKNLTYTVNTPSGPRVLLDNVQGWVKPGMLGALMGSSVRLLLKILFP